MIEPLLTICLVPLIAYFIGAAVKSLKENKYFGFGLCIMIAIYNIIGLVALQFV